MMIDHVHLLLSIPPKMSVSSFMGYLKGKSALMMFEKHANLKYKFGNRHFWAEGYYVSTVGLNEATIRKYIEDQEKHDIALDKLSVREYEDPFKGGERGKGNRLEQSESQRLEALAGSMGLQPQSKPPVGRVVLIEKVVTE